MSFADRTGGITNTFAGRPDKSTTSAAYRVRASEVNQNFADCLLAIGVAAALGTEVADNGSTSTICKLTLLEGRFEVGDIVLVREDRGTDRVWVVTVGASLAIQFQDSDLQDSGDAGTADYDTIQNDLLIVQVAPQGKSIWPVDSLLCGGAHGLDGSDMPWKDGETDTVADKFEELEAAIPSTATRTLSTFCQEVSKADPTYQTVRTVHLDKEYGPGSFRLRYIGAWMDYIPAYGAATSDKKLYVQVWLYDSSGPDTHGEELEVAAGQSGGYTADLDFAVDTDTYDRLDIKVKTETGSVKPPARVNISVVISPEDYT